jgi:hypothetical protein
LGAEGFGLDWFLDDELMVMMMVMQMGWRDI